MSQRDRLKKEANEMSAWANDMEKKLIEQLLDAADVIICTLVASANSVLDGRKFRTVVIDEAAQALEPAAWIPILKASRVILAGDPFQLPPTVKSQEAKKGGFDKTLLEKCLVRLPSVNFSLTNILLLNFGTLIVCLMMMVLPTMIITRINPIKAIRYS